MRCQYAVHEFIPGVRTPVMTYDGTVPGPTFKARVGEPVVIEGSELLARCIQHETDHLDGIMFVDRLDAGHEIASHGYWHRKVTTLSPEAFREDLTRAKQVLEDLSGAPVLGYRAPSFSIGHRNLWALDCIQEAGYRYSSSIYPVKHDHYGMPDAPRFPFESRPGLTEIPITTTRAFGRNFPGGGGGFFRLLPYAASRWLIGRVNRLDRRPGFPTEPVWQFYPKHWGSVASRLAWMRAASSGCT